MLLLTRRMGESICIAGDIVVTVVSITGNQVKIGVTAPKNVSVDREEIADRKRAEKAALP